MLSRGPFRGATRPTAGMTTAQRVGGTLCACKNHVLWHIVFSLFEWLFFQTGEVSLEALIQEFWLARGVPQSKMQEPSYFHHLVSWWPHRNDPNVLLLFFEDLKEDLGSAVRAVAEFMGVTDEGHIQVALERSTFSFMKQHEDRFADQFVKKVLSEALGLPKDAPWDGIQQGPCGF